MLKYNNGEKFHRLRNEHPFMAYNGFDYQYSDKGLRAQFHFSLSDKFVFHPTLTIPPKEFFMLDNIRDEYLENLLFHIGMAESISYWKAACPPRLVVRGRSLSEDQVRWWKKLFYKGLGEFRFLNSIEVAPGDFIRIESEGGQPFPLIHPRVEDSALVPVGGGKDSVVTLEMLAASGGTIPLILNPRKASKGSVMKMGIYHDSIVEVNRTIDPVLLDLNAQGFLNGHTPFSALLGFVAVLAAMMSGRKYIALSNESSANEPTLQEEQVNHQYSKSIEFEEDLRYYITNYLSPDIEYFSFLRPLNELQIARLFSGYTAFFDVFRSCNVGSKTDTWCGKCAKCLFTYLVLSPFLSQEELTAIFGKNLLGDEELWPILAELAGLQDTKPFDCVGTVEEVNVALQMTLRLIGSKDLPVLLRRYKDTPAYIRYLNSDPGSLLSGFSGNHFLPSRYEELLRSHIHV